MSHKIKIEWLSDSHECDTCGTSWATGANVWIDGILTLELLPHAHCYEESHYNPDEVYKRILHQLGYEVEEVDAKA